MDRMDEALAALLAGEPERAGEHSVSVDCATCRHSVTWSGRDTPETVAAIGRLADSWRARHAHPWWERLVAWSLRR